MSALALLLELTKARVTAAVTVSTAAGYLLFARAYGPNLAYAAAGVFLLACGACALNQVQDRAIDARMGRTAVRPLPAGRIDPASAAFIAGLLILGGLYLLASVDRHAVEILALAGFSVVWYNGVYTYLKRVTAFAVVPGALVGAVPPLIGFAAAGGVITDPLILAVAAFLYVWQIPHFWLLLIRYGSEYERAGLPSLSRAFSADALRRMTSAWLLATAAAGLAAGVVARLDVPWSLALVVASAALAVQAVRLRDRASWPRRAFVAVTAYAMAVMLALALNAAV